MHPLLQYENHICELFGFSFRNCKSWVYNWSITTMIFFHYNSPYIATHVTFRVLPYMNYIKYILLRRSWTIFDRKWHKYFVRKQIRLGQSWTPPWAVTSDNRAKENGLGTRLQANNSCVQQKDHVNYSTHSIDVFMQFKRYKYMTSTSIKSLRCFQDQCYHVLNKFCGEI